MTKAFKITSTLFLILQMSLSTGVFAQAKGAAKKTEKKLEVVLGIDKSEQFDFTPSKVRIGNPGVLSHTLIPQQKRVMFKGLKPGTTSVTIWDAVGGNETVYIVKVTSTAQSKTVAQLREFLGDVEGLDIGIKAEKVYVGGEIVVPSDIGKVTIVLAMKEFEEVVRLVELSPHTQRIIAQKMQSEIQNNGMKDVTVRIVNRLFWLEGVVDSEAKKQRAKEIAIAYLPENIQSLAQQTGAVETVQKSIIQDFVTVNEKSAPEPIPKLIKITAQFVELTKDYNKIFGFKWIPLMAGSGGEINIGKTASGGVSTQSAGTLAATISNLFPKLASAKSAGHARVIQSGVIVVKNEVEGTISKNSKKPFSLGTGEFTKAAEAQSGFSLAVTPRTLEDEKINMSVNIEVSSNIGDPPETLSNKLKTELVVKSKSSAVIGGVVVNKSSTDFDRNPPFASEENEAQGGTPLFSFVRSKSYLSNKSQFVVFVTPEVIESASDGTNEIKRKFRKRRR